MGAGNALARIEAAALRARSVQDFLRVVDELRTLAPDEADRLLDLIRTLPGTTPNLAATLRAAMVEAVRTAGTYAIGAIAAAPGGTSPIVTPASLVSASSGRIVDAAAQLDATVARAISQASLLAAGGAPLDVVVAPLSGAATSVRATITTSVHDVGNTTIAQLADQAELPTVWVAETDACVDCLAYSGQIADVGDGFPEGLTFGRVSRVRPTGSPLVAPPLHPNCRCEIEPLGDREYAEALRREAERSVLRGFSLESESMRARIEAAELLLRRGVDAPASVIRYAERYVAEGRFPSRT